VEARGARRAKRRDGPPPLAVAIGSGKGGAGKTAIAANLAIALGRLEKRVVAADLDLGGANLHTLLGVRAPGPGIKEYLLGSENDLCSLLVETPAANVRLLGGAGNVPGIANLPYARKARLLRALAAIDADILVIDLGPGIPWNVVDCFLGADLGLVVSTPEATSIANCFGFLKACVFRTLERALTARERASGIGRLFERARDPQNKARIRTIDELFAAASALDERASVRIEAALARLHLELVLSQVRFSEETRLASLLESLARKYLRLALPLAGTIPFDEAVPASIRTLWPALLVSAEGPFGEAIAGLARRVAGCEKKEPANSAPRRAPRRAPEVCL
jgi:flagellar biosynthesis protein FlhG